MNYYDEEPVLDFSEIEASFARNAAEAAAKVEELNVIEVKQGKITRLAVNRKMVGSISDDCHLCMDCHNAYTEKCSKVHDIYKKDLSEYPYITEGFQVLSPAPYNHVMRFVVSECENFDSDENYQKKKRR